MPRPPQFLDSSELSGVLRSVLVPADGAAYQSQVEFPIHSCNRWSRIATMNVRDLRPSPEVRYAFFSAEGVRGVVRSKGAACVPGGRCMVHVRRWYNNRIVFTVASNRLGTDGL
jgi:hypothetical protein